MELFRLWKEVRKLSCDKMLKSDWLSENDIILEHAHSKNSGKAVRGDLGPWLLGLKSLEYLWNY